jgi:hypothetical protein
LAVLFYVLKKQDYFLTFWLYHQKHLHSLSLFHFELTSTPSVPTLIDVPSGFSSAAGASLVTSIVWLVVASGASSFFARNDCQNRQ